MNSLVQLKNSSGTRMVALVEHDALRLLDGVESVYTLCQRALASGEPLVKIAQAAAGSKTIPYDAAYFGGEWTILPAFDHPAEPARCFVSGTGLTHRASVDNRNAMHQTKTVVTDSMRMYESGLEGGTPEPGTIGVSPEWFYKGNGTCLRGHGQALTVPAFSEDGGDESEIAGIYIIDNQGQPRRVGMAQGNEFSDHILEKRNYLYLASCKLRECSIGPELILDPEFHAVPGVARVRRGNDLLWEKPIKSGEANMCHSLENMEHHHFKFPLHRRPGDAHIHFFGASGFSFGDQVLLTNGDVMEVNFEGYGRPLRNPVAVEAGPASLARVLPL
ncbi:MAG: AraD1 family protein [Bryobacteraceae bacterium]